MMSFPEITQFMGHDLKYWSELERRFNAGAGPDGEALLKEVIELRGKVSFYESRIKQMAAMIK